MPHPIEQPARDPSRRLPAYLRPNMSDDALQTLAAIDRRADRRDASIPATAITRIDVPFEDVFWLAFKLFIAEAILAIPVLILWLVLLS